MALRKTEENANESLSGMKAKQVFSNKEKKVLTTFSIEPSFKAELEALLIREGAPGQILYRSHIEQAISSVDGEENHVLVSPSEDVVCGNTKVLVMGEVDYVET